MSERLGRASGSKRATRLANHILDAVVKTQNRTQNRARQRYRLNAPQVIAETIAGEAMIVNLATGHYFSLQGSGVDIWAEIEREQAYSDIVAAIERRYVAEEGEIETAVQMLVDELESENLIVRIGENGYLAAMVAVAESERGPSGNGSQPDVQDRRQFLPPALAKFTDMQDIILLDPVHEVDASGWPHAPASS